MFKIFKRNTDENGEPIVSAGLFTAKFSIFIVIILVFFYSIWGFYRIYPSQKGVVLTLGKVTDVTAQGFHHRWPIFQTVYKVDTEKLNREVFGYRDTKQEKDIHEESYKVTRDGKAVNVFYVVQYKVEKPVDFIMNLPKNKEVKVNTVRNVMESNMSTVVNSMLVDDIITKGKEKLQNDARLKIQEACNTMNFGIKIVQVVIQETEAPTAEVKKAYAEINTAMTEKNTAIIDANRYAAQQKEKANGEVAEIINNAKSIADSKLYAVKGECDRVNMLSAEYKKNPTLTRRVLYLDMIKKFLTENGQNIILVEGNNNINIIPIKDLIGKEANKE